MNTVILSWHGIEPLSTVTLDKDVVPLTGGGDTLLHVTLDPLYLPFHVSTFTASSTFTCSEFKRSQEAEIENCHNEI